jgi:hypothetical protein
LFSLLNLAIGSNPYRGFAVAFRVALITKQSRGQTFRTSGAFCFLFEFGGIAGVPFSIGEDYSSIGPNDGQFDKTRWSLVLGAGRLVFQKALAEMCGLYWRAPYPDHAKLVDLLAGNYPFFQDLLAN